MNKNQITGGIPLFLLLFFTFLPLNLSVTGESGQTLANGADSHSAKTAGGKIVFGWATFQDTRWPSPYNSGSIPADSLPWDALTHVGLFAANGNIPPQSYYVNQYGPFTAKAHAEGVYAGITVGGSGDAALVTMINGGPASWAPWIAAYISYVDQHGMDFIEFDLESGGYSTANIEGFFVALYDSFSTRQSGLTPSMPPFIVLTANVPHSISWSTPGIKNRVAFVNLMTYDYNNNAWGRVTFDCSPKSYRNYDGSGGATDSIGTGVNAIAPSMQRMAIRVNAAGWPMDKINVGVDFNGGSWTNATVIRQSTSGTGSGGSSATFAGNWDTFVTLPPDSIFFDQIAQAYWARVGTNLWTWLSLPGRDSGIIATRKVIDSMGLGGVCIWNLGNEVWNASPVPPGGRGWFFSQIRKHFDFGGVAPPPPPPPDEPKIKGKVFFDANQNGALDPGELPVAGRTVTLNGALTAQALTDSSGGFSFIELPLGGYSVGLTEKTLWDQTLPAGQGDHAVTIDSSGDVIQADFGTYSASAFNFPANRNWNIISIPVTPPDMSTGFNFPLGLTPAYDFHGGYVIVDEVIGGNGYWMKFGTGHDVWIAGSRTARDSVYVVAGWNFIGSISEIVPVANIRTEPPDLLTRYIYGYEGGSVVSNQIEPGKGYWVYALDTGKVIITNTGLNPVAGTTVLRQDSGLNELIFTSATGERQSLYFSFAAGSTESFPAPPSPPGEPFAARFGPGDPENGGSMIELFTPESAPSAETPITLSNASYPMSIEWKIAPGTPAGRLSAANGWSVTLEGSGVLDGYYPQGSGAGEPGMVLTGPGSSGSAVPTEYRLEQNFPNPFNGSTVINFSILEESRVRLELFNVLGETVLTLVDRAYSPGLHSASLRSDELPTGIYLYRLTAENASGRRFFATKKLVLLK